VGVSFRTVMSTLEELRARVFGGVSAGGPGGAGGAAAAAAVAEVEAVEAAAAADEARMAKIGEMAAGESPLGILRRLRELDDEMR